MQEYLIVRVMGGYFLHIPHSECYGKVEIRPPNLDCPNELIALQKSLNSTKDNIDLKFAMRLAIVIGADSMPEANLEAEEYFGKVIDILSTDLYRMQKIISTRTGFTMCMQNGKIKPNIIQNSPPMNAFSMSQGEYHPLNASQFFFTVDNELASRYKNSAHWSCKAKREENLQLKILFYWFPAEALLKIDESDNIISTVQACLGFPTGNVAFNLKDSPFEQSLHTINDYKSWKRHINRILEQIRNFRNNSVHSGFRIWDMSRNDLIKYEFVIEMAISKSQESIKIAIFELGIHCLKEYKIRLHETLPKMNNFLPWLEGTFIYSLKAPSTRLNLY